MHHRASLTFSGKGEEPAATTDLTASLTASFAASVAFLEAACIASGMPSMAGTAQLGSIPGCRLAPLSFSSIVCAAEN